MFWPLLMTCFRWYRRDYRTTSNQIWHFRKFFSPHSESSCSSFTRLLYGVLMYYLFDHNCQNYLDMTMVRYHHALSLHSGERFPSCLLYKHFLQWPCYFRLLKVTSERCKFFLIDWSCHGSIYALLQFWSFRTTGSFSVKHFVTMIRFQHLPWIILFNVQHTYSIGSDLKGITKTGRHAEEIGIQCTIQTAIFIISYAFSTIPPFKSAFRFTAIHDSGTLTYLSGFTQQR